MRGAAPRQAPRPSRAGVNEPRSCAIAITMRRARHDDDAHMPLNDAVAAIPVVVATALLADTSITTSQDSGSEAPLCGFPAGLSQALVSSTRVFPVRYWILDNSGSMNTGDSSRLLASPETGDAKFVKATRWQELMDAAAAAAEVSSAIGGEMHMHLLNKAAGALQFLTISPSDQQTGLLADGGGTGCDDGDKPVRRGVVSSEVDVPALRGVLEQVSPAGSTPLTEAVERVTALLRPRAAALRGAGQQAVVTLATDGMPDAPASFTRAMQRLAALGCVWIVVRLCTADRAVADYWAELDAALEAPLEVQSFSQTLCRCSPPAPPPPPPTLLPPGLLLLLLLRSSPTSGRRRWRCTRATAGSPTERRSTARARSGCRRSSSTSSTRCAAALVDGGCRRPFGHEPTLRHSSDPAPDAALAPAPPRYPGHTTPDTHTVYTGAAAADAGAAAHRAAARLRAAARARARLRRVRRCARGGARRRREGLRPAAAADAAVGRPRANAPLLRPGARARARVLPRRLGGARRVGLRAPTVRRGVATRSHVFNIILDHGTCFRRPHGAQLVEIMQRWTASSSTRRPVRVRS